MPTLIAGVPGRSEESEVDLGEGEGLLLGREPDGQVVIEEAGAPARLRPVAIDAPTISANHLAAWRDGDAVMVLDVGSRHGSWLNLPRGKAVRVAITNGESVRVKLGEVPVDSTRTPGPNAASWTDANDFGPGIAASVKTWLEELGVPARVQVATRARRDETPDHPGRIPLAAGGDLSILPLQTMDAHWPRLLEEVWRHVGRENALLESEQDARAEGMILASVGIRRVHRQVVEAAQRGMRALIVGPSGTGKEGLARAYHRNTGRSGPFVARNCATLTREFLRAELFGAESGAYTGIQQRMIGAVERAHGGTLLLDELGEMSIDVQPMLLRFLDRGEFERLGEYGRTRKADVRIVASTNRDLRVASQRNQFRADLWYRLSQEVIEVPPLHERFEDAIAFLKLQPLRRGGVAWDLISPGAEEELRAHRWEGNFRELENFTERLVASVAQDGREWNEPIDGRACRALLSRGTLAPLASPAGERGDAGNENGAGAAGINGAEGNVWGRVTASAASAFAEDYGHAVPETWDEVKDFIEKYLKPVLFVQLGSGEVPGSLDEVDVRALAQRLAADRGTATKQLARYFERFGR